MSNFNESGIDISFSYICHKKMTLPNETVSKYNRCMRCDFYHIDFRGGKRNGRI